MDSVTHEFLVFLRNKGGALAVGRGNSAALADHLRVPSEELERIAHVLQGEGFAKLERTSPGSFFVEITPQGEQYLTRHQSPVTRVRSGGLSRRTRLLFFLVGFALVAAGFAAGYLLRPLLEDYL